MQTLQSYKTQRFDCADYETNGSTATAYFDGKYYDAAEVLVTIGALKTPTASS